MSNPCLSKNRPPGHGPGARCSILTTSLDNISLNFLNVNITNTLIIFIEKCTKLLHCKRFSYLLKKTNGVFDYMSRVVRQPDFCICENKDADQFRGNREADQRLCFRYKERTIRLLPKSEISSL